MTEAPWTFAEATAKCRQAAVAQSHAEDAYLAAARDFAAKEEAYRKALAAEIVKTHADGVAWSTAPDLARGDETVARLRMERDIAEGVREAMEQALWRMAANRKDAQRFADWSQRRELAEGAGMVPEQDGPVYGRRAA